jgi:hypothetical protein
MDRKKEPLVDFGHERKHQQLGFGNHLRAIWGHDSETTIANQGQDISNLGNAGKEGQFAVSGHHGLDVTRNDVQQSVNSARRDRHPGKGWNSTVFDTYFLSPDSIWYTEGQSWADKLKRAKPEFKESIKRPMTVEEIDEFMGMSRQLLKGNHHSLANR